MPNVIEYQDSNSTVVHNDFKAWCRANDGAPFLAFKSKSKANLHVSGGCHHNGGGLWLYDGQTSITASRKVCFADMQDVHAWTQDRRVEWKWCKHCKDGTSEPISPAATNVRTGAQQAAPAAASVKAGTLQAIEGIAREVSAIVMSRSSALRDEALARAQGTCQACAVDFSGVLQGRGARALQVHHVRQLALLEIPTVTVVDDLAVVCANCHAIIHSDPTLAMTIEQLRGLWCTERGDPRQPSYQSSHP